MSLVTLFRVIGGGRAGLSFVSALQRSGWTCDKVYGPTDDVTGAAAGVKLVIVAVPDENIAAVAASIAPDEATTSFARGRP